MADITIVFMGFINQQTPLGGTILHYLMSVMRVIHNLYWLPTNICSTHLSNNMYYIYTQCIVCQVIVCLPEGIENPSLMAIIITSDSNMIITLTISYIHYSLCKIEWYMMIHHHVFLPHRPETKAHHQLSCPRCPRCLRWSWSFGGALDLIYVALVTGFP